MAKQQAILQDYRKLDIPALNIKIIAGTHRLQELQAELAIRKLTNHSAIRKLKQDLARLATIRQEKLILDGIQKDE